jgi:superoxide dismutase, Fe-Mn family
MYKAKPLNFKPTNEGISAKTLAIHYDKLYMGYVNKKNEIEEKLAGFEDGTTDLSSANQTFSDLRALKDGETFAANGVWLHEHYFDVLGSDGKPNGKIVDAITERYGSIKTFLAYFGACGMAARGWVVLAWNTNENKLAVYTGDAHNQGGVWGAIPILVLDVYEHAYFLDYGSDRKSYIEEYINEINWSEANKKYEAAIK